MHSVQRPLLIHCKIVVNLGIRRLLRRRSCSERNARQENAGVQAGGGAIRQEAKQITIEKPEQAAKQIRAEKVLIGVRQRIKFVQFILIKFEKFELELIIWVFAVVIFGEQFSEQRG